MEYHRGVEMTNGKSDDCGWNEWRDILLNAFEYRRTAISEKGYQLRPLHNTFTALFLQVKGFKVPVADILPEAIRIIRERKVNDSCYDTIAMIGHRIGMVDNIVGLKQYFQDLYQLLRPEGQVLLTSLDVHTTNEPEHMSYQRQNIQSERYLGVSSMQFQRTNLIGPFFSMLRIKAEIIRRQVAMTNWQYEVIHQQDDGNFLVRLSMSEANLE